MMEWVWQWETESTKYEENTDQGEASEMVSSDVQEVASERGTNEWCRSNTEVDGAEQRGDVVIDDTDQDQHAGDLGSLVDILTF